MFILVFDSLLKSRLVLVLEYKGFSIILTDKDGIQDFPHI